jgi:hypothetical protein
MGCVGCRILLDMPPQLVLSYMSYAAIGPRSGCRFRWGGGSQVEATRKSHAEAPAPDPPWCWAATCLALSAFCQLPLWFNSSSIYFRFSAASPL